LGLLAQCLGRLTSPPNSGGGSQIAENSRALLAVSFSKPLGISRLATTGIGIGTPFSGFGAPWRGAWITPGDLLLHPGGSTVVLPGLGGVLTAKGDEHGDRDINIHGELGDLSEGEVERVREDGDVYIQVEDGRVIHVDGSDVVVDEYEPDGKLRLVTSMADYTEKEVERNLDSGRWISLNE
jgi:hypothetical protein